MSSLSMKIIGAVVLLFLAAILGVFHSWGVHRRVSELHSYRSLMDIGLALHWYVDREKVLPPTYARSTDGEPLLSWRVALLPMVGEAELYQKFKLDEPWDSPSNLPLLDQMPEVYRSDFCNSKDRGMCSFVILTDDDTAFPVPNDHNRLGFRQIEDGLSRTLLAIELPEAPQPWTKPEVVTPTEVIALLNRRRKGEMLLLSFLDGSVSKFRGYFGDETFKAICTRAGYEDVDLESLPGFDPR